MSDSPLSRRRTIGFSLGVGMALLWFLVADHYATRLLWFVRPNVWWVLLVVPVLGLFVLAYGRMQSRYRRGGRRRKGEDDDGNRGRDGGELVGTPPSALAVWGTFAAACVAALAAFVYVSVHAYQVDKIYAASIEVREAEAPDFDQRAPFVVAKAQERSNLGDVPGDVADTTYLPGDNVFTTLVDERGVAGYATVLTQSLPLTGRASAERCDFSADRRLGGWFDSSLERLISSERRGVRVHREDAYAFCDAAGVPTVVLPLVEQDGWWLVHEKPAGVAVYDGRQGVLELADSARGPSYPISIAARQREASAALGGWSDHVVERVGYETTGGGNSSEYAVGLAGSDGAVYLSPLTGRGDATAVSAFSTVPTQGRVGLAPLTVYTSPDWVSVDAIEKRVRGDYNDIPNWPNLRLFEVTPTSTNTWVATLGNDQNVLYRVVGTGTLQPEGDLAPTCLQRADGTTIRCGTLADTGDNGVGVQYDQDLGTSSPDDDGSVGAGAADVPDGPLRRLDDVEFQELMRRVTEEAIRRQDAGSQRPGSPQAP